MRSFGQILSGTTPVWSKIPMGGKIVIVAGTIILAGSELTQIVNEAWRSSRIYEGNAAQGDSQSNPDVVKTLADLQSGKPTPAATASVAMTYSKLEAEAREKLAIADAAQETVRQLSERLARAEATSTETQKLLEVLRTNSEVALRAAEAREKQAIADAATESEETLVQKLRKGIKLSTTESIRLSELRQKRAEATAREWDAYAADETAIAQRKAAAVAGHIFDQMQTGNGNGVARGMSDMRRAIFNGGR
jgi:hypothetical protein